MEKKQLNLNAPFYSARRYTSPSRSSELPKPNRDGPLPPPSRQQSLVNFEQDDEEVIITEPPTSFVPFHWEHTPGRPKCQAGLSSSVRFHSGEIPKLPPGRLSSRPLLYKPQVEAFSFGGDHASLLERLDQSLKCGTESEGDGEEEEEEEDAYSDALEALSYGELQSLNYSVGGISGCHGSSGAEPSGTFSVDAQTRDLMMNRFLPAAKAAVLETQTPQYAAKKKKKSTAVAGELPKQMPKKVFSGELKTRMEKKYGLGAALPRLSINFTDNYQESEDDEYVERRIPIKKPGKRWGIIPIFCARSSLSLVNPLPALKSKSRPQTPSFAQVRRITTKALSGPLDKISCTVPHKKKFHSGLLSRELPTIERKLPKDSNTFPNYSRGLYSLSTSPLRRYRSGNSSPCRNEVPKSPSLEGAGFSSAPKKAARGNCTDGQLASSRKLFKALQDVSRNQKNDPRSPDPLSGYGNFLMANKSLDHEPWPLDKDEDGYEVKRVIKEERKVEANDGTEFAFVVKSPLPPPLPKSPSESWLWRTLPLGNPFSHSNRKVPVRPKELVDPKWETIVKSTNLHRETVRHSQEHTPRGQKTNHSSKGNYMKK